MRQIIYLILIVTLGFAVYSNSLHGKFIWDDLLLVRDNTFIKSWSNISKVFTENLLAGAREKSAFWRPLQLITYMIDYSTWELNVIGYHLTNIFLHTLVALSIYWLINLLFNDKLLSFLTAISFAVHPIHTEAVSYISGRADPLSVLFMLLCLILYIRDKSPILILLTYMLALLSREGSLILPLLILLYHYAFKKEFNIGKFMPILAITFIYIILRITILKTLLLQNESCPFPLHQRLPGFFVAIINYIKLLFLPFNLHMEYGGKLFKFNDPKAMVGALLLAILLIYAFKKKKDRPLLFFSLFWFFIALMPVSNIYPINAYMAEHWLYLPSIGLFLILAYMLCSIYKIKELKTFAAVFIIILLIFYSYLTIKQNNIWREPIVFYERMLTYAPKSVRMLTSLGLEYSTIDKNEKAITLYKKAIEINPNFQEAYNNLGIAYYNIGKKEEAIASFKKAIEIAPDYAYTYNNLGKVYINLGKNVEAIALYKKALEIDPDYTTVHFNLSIAYFLEKQYDLAIKHCDKAIELGYEVPPEFLRLLKPYRH